MNAAMLFPTEQNLTRGEAVKWADKPPTLKENSMTIKTKNQAPATDRTDDRQLLADGELDCVAGGIQITKVMDATSPLLSQESLVGKSVRID
jgi:type VI protein secretion system component Hcp